MPATGAFIIDRASCYLLLHVLADVRAALLLVFANQGKCEGANGHLAGEELQHRLKNPALAFDVRGEQLAASQ